MRRSIVWAVTFALSLSVMSLLAQQQQTGQAPSKAAAQQPALKTHSGEVVSVDTAKSEIVIKQRTGKEMTLSVASDARITKGRQTITLSDLKPGDRVTTRCDESTGKHVLKRISVRAAAGAAAKTS